VPTEVPFRCGCTLEARRDPSLGAPCKAARALAEDFFDLEPTRPPLEIEGQRPESRGQKGGGVWGDDEDGQRRELGGHGGGGGGL
jgi:hypothetical protein